MTAMTMEPPASEYFADLPGALVVRALYDLDFALRLLHQDSRQGAIDELGLDLTDEQLSELHTRLDTIANMSFQEAIGALRSAGASVFM
jgi:hypothetical protein